MAKSTGFFRGPEPASISVMRRSIEFPAARLWAALAACVLLGGAAGCQAEGDASATRPSGTQTSGTQPADTAPVDPATAARVRAALDARLAEVDTTVRRLPGLIASIRRDMRRHLNADHVVAAQRYGVGPVRDSTHVEALVRAGRLVRLPESARWWVVRELDQSLPYVTPGTMAALEEIGRRFHDRLEQRGLPPFRFEVTSALRTGEQQAALRRRNRNASGTTSSHEFGTTVDIAYLGFSAPQDLEQRSWAQLWPGGRAPADPLVAQLRAQALLRLDSLATRYANHIEGELGAVLQELQREGVVWPLRERGQPVYHTTLAGDVPAGTTTPVR